MPRTQTEAKRATTFNPSAYYLSEMVPPALQISAGQRQSQQGTQAGAGASLTTSLTTARNENGPPSRTSVHLPFRPINDDHAIEQVVFTLHFERPFGEADLSVFRLNHLIWSEDLPALREAQGLTMGLLADKSMRAESIPGVEFAYLRPNGNPIWSLRVLGPDVTVECTRYSRWAKVWAAAQTHLDKVLGLIERTGLKNDLKRVSFVVQDAFTASTEDYDLRSLLKDSAFVPASVFANGANWHSHCGWFEEVEGHRLLQNINLDAVGGEMAVAASGAAARVAVVHIQSATRKDGAAKAKAQSEWLDEVMNVMHRRNLETVLQLIDDGMLERIGLSGGADE